MMTACCMTRMEADGLKIKVVCRGFLKKTPAFISEQQVKKMKIRKILMLGMIRQFLRNCDLSHSLT